MKHYKIVITFSCDDEKWTKESLEDTFLFPEGCKNGMFVVIEENEQTSPM